MLRDRAAAVACGQVLVFANDDAAIARTHGLTLAADLAGHQACGAVAAKLLYPSGRRRGGSVVGPGDCAVHIEST